MNKGKILLIVELTKYCNVKKATRMVLRYAVIAGCFEYLQ